MSVFPVELTGMEVTTELLKRPDKSVSLGESLFIEIHDINRGRIEIAWAYDVRILPLKIAPKGFSTDLSNIWCILLHKKVLRNATSGKCFFFQNGRQTIKIIQN